MDNHNTQTLAVVLSELHLLHREAKELDTYFNSMVGVHGKVLPDADQRLEKIKHLVLGLQDALTLL